MFIIVLWRAFLKCFLKSVHKSLTQTNRKDESQRNPWSTGETLLLGMAHSVILPDDITCDRSTRQNRLAGAAFARVSVMSVLI